MITPRDDWGQDEREALAGLDGQLRDMRLRHAEDPPCDLLGAAYSDVLPAETQARVMSQLAESAWARAIAEGLSQCGTDAGLDAASEERLLRRIRSEFSDAPRRQAWRARSGVTIGGLALAASLLMGVVVNRGRFASVPVPAATPRVAEGPATAPPPQAPVQLAFTKPDVKLSTAALTWRGAGGDHPFLSDLSPALDAYRAGDYARAASAFDGLSRAYPTAIEVLFYQGVTLMLQDDFEGALAPLAAAARLGDQTFSADASWYLAVAEQRTGSVRAARSRLSALCNGAASRAADACAAVATIDAVTPTEPGTPR